MMPELWFCFAVPFILCSFGTRVGPARGHGVSDTSARAMDHGGRSPCTGNWPGEWSGLHFKFPLRYPLQLQVGGCLERTAAVPNAELPAVDAWQTSAACPKQLSTKRGPGLPGPAEGERGNGLKLLFDTTTRLEGPDSESDSEGQ